MSDGAIRYLLTEAPLRYLSGDRDGRGMVRNPAPEVLKGDVRLIRHVINHSRNRHKYVSGVLSFERLISREHEQQILQRFERVAFCGLREDQYACLWVAHRHLKRTELHFLVPRTELTSLRALNINPPRQRKEGLFDAFRKLINHEFNLKEPSGVRLTPGDRDRLVKKIDGMMAARAAYNRSRYPLPQADRSVLSPFLYEDRTRSSRGGLPAPGRAVPPARPPTRPALERLGCASREIGQAGQCLELAGEHLVGAARPIPERLNRLASERRRRSACNTLFARYGIPESHRVKGTSRQVERGGMVRELTREP